MNETSILRSVLESFVHFEICRFCDGRLILMFGSFLVPVVILTTVLKSHKRHIFKYSSGFFFVFVTA